MATGNGQLEQIMPALEARLPALLDDVGRLLQGDWPDYARFLAEDSVEVTAAATAFMRRLVAIADRGLSVLPQHPMPKPGAQDAMFEEIGRIQWREGRELTTLLSAYQVGARVAWRHVSSTAVSAGAAPDALAALAEAVFVFVDELSSASARGYVLEQSEAAVTRERLREEVAELLLSDRSDSAAVRAAAARAGWALPREAAVVLVHRDNAVGRELLSKLEPACLPIRQPTLVGAIVPDPSGPGRRARLAAALRGGDAVIGHAVSLEHLPASARIAEIAAQLKRSGVLTEDPIFADEHLDAIIVHRDARLLEALRRQCLAPLDDLAPAVRQRLNQTLTSWLRHMGDRQAVAAELHIHPQTVRYRMSQLHEAFGPALDDPETRNRLTLALVWGWPAETSGAAAPLHHRRRKGT